MATETPDQAPIAELEYEPSAFEQALARHKNKLIMVAVIAGIGAAGYYTTKLIKEHSNQVSGNAFYKATTLEDYRKVAKEQAGKSAGGNAQLMVAQTLTDDGKPEEAVKELETFLKDYPDHDLADLATLRLADAHMLNGAADKAKAKFEELYGKFPKSAQAPLALLRLGDLYAAEKNAEKAKEYYELLKVKYPGTEPYLATAIEHRDALALKDPTLVPFVAEPTPAPTPSTPPGGLQVNPTTPSTELSSPSLTLDPNAPAPALGGEKSPLEAPKLENPVTPAAPGTPATPADPTPAAPVPAAPATDPAPAAPAAPAPAPEAPATAPK